GLVGFGMSCPLLPGGAGSIAGIAIGFVARGAGSGLRPARLQTLVPGIHVLKREDFSSNRHRALAHCLSMILSENRYTLFGIMLQRGVSRRRRSSQLPQFRTGAFRSVAAAAVVDANRGACLGFEWAGERGVDAQD